MLRRSQGSRALALCLGAAVLMAGCKTAYPPTSSRPSAAQPPTGQRPLPMAGQVGLPVAATQAAVPADNPQTPDAEFAEDSAEDAEGVSAKPLRPPR